MSDSGRRVKKKIKKHTAPQQARTANRIFRYIPSTPNAAIIQGIHAIHAKNARMFEVA
jgi:hypothetical protein